ncbi:MAG: hypothetical protein PWQ10_617 [Patescibacteria group bacterium]|nr:hypothetical protein [Patescibacteria group bacterium]
MTKSTKLDYKKYRYNIMLDINRDAWNWYASCNRSSHGVNWGQKISDDIVNEIKGKDETEAKKIIIPFLEKKYVEEASEIEIYKSSINYDYFNNFELTCLKIVELTNKALYRNDFTIFLTTFPRGPYNYSEGYLYIKIGWQDPIKLFMHELLHFQFIHYWRENPNSKVHGLSNEQFEWLKESLTVILDEDLYPLVKSPDKGYFIHQKFREQLHSFWKTNNDFNKLIGFGLEKLSDFIPSNE